MLHGQCCFFKNNVKRKFLHPFYKITFLNSKPGAQMWNCHLFLELRGVQIPMYVFLTWSYFIFGGENIWPEIPKTLRRIIIEPVPSSHSLTINFSAIFKLLELFFAKFKKNLFSKIDHKICHIAIVVKWNFTFWSVERSVPVPVSCLTDWCRLWQQKICCQVDLGQQRLRTAGPTGRSRPANGEPGLWRLGQPGAPYDARYKPTPRMRNSVCTQSWAPRPGGLWDGEKSISCNFLTSSLRVVNRPNC